MPSVSSGIFCWMFNGLYSYKDLFLFDIRSIIGFLGALKKNSVLLWIVSFAFDFLDVYYTLGWLFPAILLPFPAFPFVSPSLTLCIQYLIMLCSILVAILVFTVLA